MNLQELKEKLIATVKDNLTHVDYQHTVDYAKWCYQVVTGRDQAELIVQYKSRESDAAKKQRVDIYNSRTKYVAGRVIQTFSKVERADNIIDNVGYPGSKNSADDLENLRGRLDVFNGDKPLERYLFDAMKRMNFFDPNGWIIVEFNNDDPLKDKPYTYPVEVYSENAVDYKIKNGITHYLTTRWSHKYKSIDKGEKTDKDGYRYIIYGIDWAIEMISADLSQDLPIAREGYSVVTISKENTEKKSYWYYKEFNTRSKVCPATRCGYLPDMQTKGRTYVSPLDSASDLFKDLINMKSEYDLSNALHGFLQKIQYAHLCEYEDPVGGACLNGTLRMNEKTCPSCDGTGLDLHKSVQDIILIKKPRDKEEHIPLDQMVHYVQVPDYIIKNQKEELEELERKVATAIFNTNVFDRSEVAITATEKRIDLESVYDVLSDYANQYSRLWEFIVKQTAIHLQIDDGLEIHHQFPSTFHLETLKELIEMRQLAVAANAPYHIVSRIDQSIAMKQNQDDTDNMMFNIARENFRPWREKSKEEIMMLVATLPRTDKNIQLWIHFEEIFTDIKNEFKDPAFYEFNFVRQKEIVDEKVQVFIDEETARAEAQRLVFGMGGNDPYEEDDEEEES